MNFISQMSTPPSSPVVALLDADYSGPEYDAVFEHFVDSMATTAFIDQLEEDARLEAEMEKYSSCFHCGQNYLTGSICDCVCTTCLQMKTECRCCVRKTPIKLFVVERSVRHGAEYCGTKHCKGVRCSKGVKRRSRVNRCFGCSEELKGTDRWVCNGCRTKKYINNKQIKGRWGEQVEQMIQQCK